MQKYRAHKRQFLVGNKAMQISEDWQTVKIGEDLYLSHCPSLAVKKSIALNGEAWYLLGIAMQTDKEKLHPLTEIENAPSGDIKELYKSWTGRWVLVSDKEVHIDCSGSLGCFYTIINGDRWVSSSLAILQKIGGLSPRTETLKYESGIEWYPLPMSRFEGVYKLLPSQFLNIRTFQPEQRALPKPVQGLSYNEILEKIAEKLTFSLSDLSGSGKRIFVALTSGYDSRLVLAATRAAGLTVETYTTAHKKITHSDYALPYKLAKAAGYRHRYIRKTAGYSKENEALYDYHAGKNIDHVDKIKFAHGEYDSFRKGDVLLRGGIFEVARCFYWKKMDPDFSVETIFKARRLDYDPESFNAKALSEWAKWAAQTPAEGIDWRDRFYLEQRVAGWLSSVEQALDLTDTERFHIINCHDLISLFLSVPVEKKKTSGHHVDLIRMMFPAFLHYPFNPPDPTFRRLQKKVIRICKKPLSKLYKKLKKLF